MSGIASLGIHDFLDGLSRCDSLDQIHESIRDWLRANPKPRTREEILARVDDALAVWYRAYYDPRAIAPAVAQLEEDVTRVLDVLGRKDDVDAKRWVQSWVHEPQPELDDKSPVLMLHSTEGLADVRRLLSQLPAEAFALDSEK